MINFYLPKTVNNPQKKALTFTRLLWLQAMNKTCNNSYNQTHEKKLKKFHKNTQKSKNTTKKRPYTWAKSSFFSQVQAWEESNNSTSYYHWDLNSERIVSMYCPICAHDKTSTESTFQDVYAVHRFRKCLSCGFVFTSVEMPNNDSRWNDYRSECETSNEPKRHTIAPINKTTKHINKAQKSRL